MVIKKYQKLSVLIDGIKKFDIFENKNDDIDIELKYEYKNLLWYFYIKDIEKIINFGNEDSIIELIIENIDNFEIIGKLNVKKDNIIQEICIYEYLRNNRIECSYKGKKGFIAYDLPTHINKSILNCKLPNDEMIYSILTKV